MLSFQVLGKDNKKQTGNRAFQIIGFLSHKDIVHSKIDNFLSHPNFLSRIGSNCYPTQYMYVSS